MNENMTRMHISVKSHIFCSFGVHTKAVSQLTTFQPSVCLVFLSPVEKCMSSMQMGTQMVKLRGSSKRLVRFFYLDEHKSCIRWRPSRKNEKAKSECHLPSYSHKGTELQICLAPAAQCIHGANLWKSYCPLPHVTDRQTSLNVIRHHMNIFPSSVSLRESLTMNVVCKSTDTGRRYQLLLMGPVHHSVFKLSSCLKASY